MSFGPLCTRFEDAGRDGRFVRDEGRDAWLEKEVVEVAQVVSVRFMLSARRRDVDRPLRKEDADWRDFTSWSEG